jgi:hypothetical protein
MMVTIVKTTAVIVTWRAWIVPRTEGAILLSAGCTSDILACSNYGEMAECAGNIILHQEESPQRWRRQSRQPRRIQTSEWALTLEDPQCALKISTCPSTCRSFIALAVDVKSIREQPRAILQLPKFAHESASTDADFHVGSFKVRIKQSDRIMTFRSWSEQAVLHSGCRCPTRLMLRIHDHLASL